MSDVQRELPPEGTTLSLARALSPFARDVAAHRALTTYSEPTTHYTIPSDVLLSVAVALMKAGDCQMLLAETLNGETVEFKTSRAIDRAAAFVNETIAQLKMAADFLQAVTEESPRPHSLSRALQGVQ